ncbi:MAG TPA: YIP1 family protein [Anaerolineaceae bacterium]|nr:YIP1 family protein [Anaerolineaceae bacterium]
MSETIMASEVNIKEKEQGSQWAWVPGILFKPRSTCKKIVSKDAAVWHIPLLILSVLAILVIIASAPIKRYNAQMGASMPEDSRWWSEEQIAKYLEAQQNMTSGTFMYLFPTISKLIGIWFNWLIFSSILYLALTLAGSRAPRLKSGNLVAWAMLPLAFRYIVELILIFSRNQLPSGTALGSLIGETKSIGLSLVKGMLGQIDAYWLWFVIILLIGGVSLAGIKRSKAFWVITLVILIMLVIQGVPTMISQYLGQLTGSGFNMYF